VIGISLGDPAGIGPEVVVKTLFARQNADAVVFGDRGVLERAAAICGVPFNAHWAIESVTQMAPDAFKPGEPNAATGAAQVAYLQAATRAALGGNIQALVTAPISKEWAGRAGFPFPGHTEFLADSAGCPDFAMMMAGPRLRTTVVTRHIALADVPDAVDENAVRTAVVLTGEALSNDFGIQAPRIAVCGLNPHASDGGKFGNEEARVIAPAQEAAQHALRERGIEAQVSGPYPADSVFREALAGEFDAVVAQYHDQGLIAAKLLDFESTVNVTLGLPFVRTSPDHGTAYNIAGSGEADPRSFEAAFDLAIRLTNRGHAGH